MASSRPRPQDPVNGGWSDVALSRPSSPPPAYSSPPTESVDVQVGTSNPLDTLYFVQSDTEEELMEEDDVSMSSDVIVEFNNLNEQLRQQRAPVVKPMPVPDEPFPFMKLPQELREHVYDDYFRAEDRLETYDLGDETVALYHFEFSLLRVSKQIYLEALRSWRKNIFVRIETPWPHAVHHIRSDGEVPIVAHGAQADAFTQHTALVQITAPLHGVTDPDHNIILHINDLSKFTSVWYYSALNYQNLNPQICLTFTLLPSPSKPIPLSLQTRLLLPFGDVKDLYDTAFHNYSPLAIAPLRTSMAIPYPTVQESVELATSRLERGDALLPSDPAAALSSYIAAFDAIHIKVSGRARRILADGHFADDIPAGRFAGQPAMTVRVVLRIRLVARVVHAYMRLGEPAEAAFWGVRTIKLLRQGAERDVDSVEAFFAARIGFKDMGGLYARTAAGLTRVFREEEFKAERGGYRGAREDGVDAEALWRRAGAYLKANMWAGERQVLAEECRAWGVEVPGEYGWEEGHE